MFTLFVILLIVLAGLMTLSLMLRHFRRQIRDDKPPHFDFTIAELHALRNAGQLTQAEFERAQETILRRAGEQQAMESLRPVNDPKRGFDVIIHSPPPPPEQ